MPAKVEIRNTSPKKKKKNSLHHFYKKAKHNIPRFYLSFYWHIGLEFFVAYHISVGNALTIRRSLAGAAGPASGISCICFSVRSFFLTLFRCSNRRTGIR